MLRLGSTLAAAGLALASLATPLAAQDFSVEIFGGVTFERDQDYSGVDYPMDVGDALGVAVYYNGYDSLSPNLSFGLDLFATHSLYIGYPDEYIDTVSLMAVARYEHAVSQTLSVYGGAGLGAIWNTYDFPGDRVEDIVPGGQLSIGGVYSFNDMQAVFLELRHQRGFDDASFDDLGGDTQEYHSTSLLIGYRHSF